MDGEFPEGDFFWISALNEATDGWDVERLTGKKTRGPFFKGPLKGRVRKGSIFLFQGNLGL